MEIRRRRDGFLRSRDDLDLDIGNFSYVSNAQSGEGVFHWRERLEFHASTLCSELPGNATSLQFVFGFHLCWLRGKR
jgi:hypothetical protein